MCTYNAIVHAHYIHVNLYLYNTCTCIYMVVSYTYCMHRNLHYSGGLGQLMGMARNRTCTQAACSKKAACTCTCTVHVAYIDNSCSI